MYVDRYKTLHLIGFETCRIAALARCGMPLPPHIGQTEVAGLTFHASFDGGNCARIERTGTDEFSLWTTPDAAGTEHVKQYKVWFSFAVRGVARGRMLTFIVHNMNNLGKLFRHDMRPVYRVLPSKPKWSRLPLPTTQTGTQAGDENFTLTFKHKCDVGVHETLYFAFCYPLTYTDSIARLAYLDHLFGLPNANVLPPGAYAASNGTAAPPPAAAPPAAAPPAAAPPASSTALEGHGVVGPVHAAALAAACSLGDVRECCAPLSGLSFEVAREIAMAAAGQAERIGPRQRPGNIYYHRELLVRSLDGRRVDVVTISGTNGMLESTEESLSAFGTGLLPEGGERPRAFANKPVFFMSARVHPGETPASHVLDGLLDFLLRVDDPRAQALRSLFVFKLVPMVNPDGVHRGHYRSDTLGQNLNRMYDQATLEKQPSVYAIRALIRQLHSTGRLKLYLDTHGHATKRGCFLYGNALPDFERMVDNVLFARVAAANCRWFDFAGCCFTERNMYRADQRDGLSKAGSGRVAIYKLTGLTYVYTLECSYNTGRLVNRLNPPATPKGMDKARVLSLSPPPPPARAASSPKYNPESWRCVGRALAVAFLDVHEANEISRLGGGMRGLRGFIGAWVRTQQKKAEASAAAGKSRGGGGGGGGSGTDEEGEEEGEPQPELRGEEEAGLSDEEEGEEGGARVSQRVVSVA